MNLTRNGNRNRSQRTLVFIKGLHTLIWLFFASAVLYVDYAALANQIDKWVWIAVSLVIFEGLILLLFSWSCPLTLIARKYSGSSKDNFDIYLPEWIAKHNKTIFTTLFVAGLVGIFIRLLT